MKVIYHLGHLGADEEYSQGLLRNGIYQCGLDSSDMQQ